MRIPQVLAALAAAVILIAVPPRVAPGRPARPVSLGKVVCDLPAEASGIAGSFSVTPDGGRAFLGIVSRDLTRSGPPVWTTRFLTTDLRTGKTSSFGHMLPVKLDHNAREFTMQPAADGRRVLVVLKKFDGPATAYVVDLAAGRATEIATGGSILAAWSGQRIILSNQAKAGLTRPLEVYAATGSKVTTMRIRGLIAGTDERGKILLVACHKTDPAKAMKTAPAKGKAKGTDVAALTAVRSDGTVIKQLGTIEKKLLPGLHVQDSPVLSPSGRYAAFEDSKPLFHVVSIFSPAWRTYTMRARPFAVTDAGDVITFQHGEIRYIDKKGRSRVLSRGARAATVAGGRFFYVTAAGSPKIKAVALPKPAK